MKIGIFGGSFDPVHVGHMTLVQELIRELRLDRVIVIPACVSPFKEKAPPRASGSDRIKMLQIAFEKEPKVEISTMEIDRGGLSYTIDTVRDLKAKFPGEEFFLLLAKDTIESFPSWKEFQQLTSMIQVVFATDRSNGYEKIDYGRVQKIAWKEASSREVRRLLGEGKGWETFLAPKVVDYIRDHHLYSPAYDNDNTPTYSKNC